MTKNIFRPFKELIMDRPLKKGIMLQERFKIKEVIGFGGYGITYLAFDHINEEDCVVKQLRPSRENSKKGKSSFEYEVNILKQLTHPNIPTLRASFKKNSHHFLVMDYIEGETFEKLIFKDKIQYSETETFQIVYKLLLLVGYIHENNIVHRDLRIPNIIMKGKELYIIDFGLARHLHEQQIEIDHYFVEKKLRRNIDITSDFYAIGHFTLFMLYSSYEPSSKKEQSWEDELTLTSEGKRIIQKLLQIRKPYSCIENIKRDIKKLLEQREEKVFQEIENSIVKESEQ